MFVVNWTMDLGDVALTCESANAYVADMAMMMQQVEEFMTSQTLHPDICLEVFDHLGNELCVYGLDAGKCEVIAPRDFVSTVDFEETLPF